MTYCHTQKAPLAYVLLVIPAVEIGLGILFWHQPAVMAVLVTVGVAMLVVALSFTHLTVSDEGEHLALRYGPLPLFRKRIAYASITQVEPDRSSFIDGWGIHYIPWRGWIYNLWGFDCVKIDLGGSIIRIGSNDVTNLVDFLRRKLGGSALGNQP